MLAGGNFVVIKLISYYNMPTKLPSVAVLLHCHSRVNSTDHML